MMEEIQDWEAHPGLLVPAGRITVPASGVRPTVFSDVANDPTALWHRAVSTFFNRDKVFIIWPKSIDSLTSAHVVAAVDTALGAVNGKDLNYGSTARWRDEAVIGIERHEIGVGDDSQRHGHGFRTINLNTEVASSTQITQRVSHVATTPNIVFYVENHGRWLPPDLFIGDDPTVSFGSQSWVGPIKLEMGGYCTGLFAYGPHLLIFKREGLVLGLDSGEVFTNMMVQKPGYEDDNFGFNSASYLHYILIPSRGGLIRLDPNSLEQARISPQTVQYGFFGADAPIGYPGRIWGVTTRQGPEFWAYGENSVASAEGNLARAATARDGFFYRDTSIRTPSSFRGGIVAQFANGRDEFVGANVFGALPTSGEIVVKGLYTEGLTSLPGTYASPNAQMRSSRVSADGMAAGRSILPTQVRLRRKINGAGFSAELAVDEGAATVLSSNMTGTGPLRLNVPSTLSPRIGRTLQLTLKHTNAVVGSVHRIDWPIAIDYEFVPTQNARDAISIKVWAGAAQLHDGTMWSRGSGVSLRDELLALKGSTTTIEFPDAVQWTVLVRDVAAIMVRAEDPHTNSPSWLVTLDCARID